jgi:polysaccharide export outer membrane protein
MMAGFVRRGMIALAAAGPLVVAGCARDDIPLTDASALAVQPVYRLGVGDMVRINVFNEPTLSGDYAVGGEGVIPFPLIGGVAAAGLTIEELIATITSRLRAGFVNNAQVSAQVAVFRPYSVLGEVSRPGRYPTGEQLSLIEAVAAAGGFTYRADQRYAYIRRDGTPQEMKVLVEANPQVLPGDVIRIGERYF